MEDDQRLDNIDPPLDLVTRRANRAMARVAVENQRDRKVGVSVEPVYKFSLCALLCACPCEELWEWTLTVMEY